MKKTLLSLIIVSITVFLLPACNKETFIETIGSSSIESADDIEVGYFMFSSKTTVGTCGTISLLINGKEVGVLTADYNQAVTACTDPPVEGKFIKVVMPVGTYQVTATVAGDCKKYITDTYTLKKGICRNYTL